MKKTASPSTSTSPTHEVNDRVTRGRKNPLWFGAARRFFDCRDQLNWSQQVIADRSGISQPAVSEFEDGKREPQIDRVEALAYAVGVPVCWLAFGQEGAERFRGKRPSREPKTPIPTPRPGFYRNEERAAQVGLRLTQLRAERGLSLRGLGGAAGITYEAIHKIERGAAMPRLDTAYRLAIALDVSPCYLAYGIEAPTRPSREGRKRAAHDGTEAQPQVSRRGKATGNRGADKAD